MLTDAEADEMVDEVAKIRMWDKPKILDMLAKHLGFYAKHAERSGKLVIQFEAGDDENEPLESTYYWGRV